MPEPTGSELLVEKEFSVSAEMSTKLHLAGDGQSLSWHEDDCISVWDGVANRKFTLKNFDEASATFVGRVDADASEFFAVYPYTDKLEVSAPEKEERDLRLRLPLVSEQKAVPSSIADGLCVAVARTQDDVLAFQNKSAMLKFSLEAGFNDVTKVTVESVSNHLSGIFNIEWEGNTSHHGIVYAGRGKTVTLANEDGAPLTTGVDYYIVLPPNSNDGGFSVSVTLADGTTLTKMSTNTSKLWSGTITHLADAPLTKAMFVQDEVEAEARYASWNSGAALQICGTSYTCANHGDGTLIKADGTAYTISAGGVYFIEPGADVTMTTSKVDDITLVGNDPTKRSAVKFSGIYLNTNADVACLGIELTPASDTWPTGKDIINENTAAGDLRFEDCRLYHPSNGRYFIYAGMSGSALASSLASLSMKDCVYTITNLSEKAYMLNCPLEGASIEFSGCTFHCAAESSVSTLFKLISLNNTGQTIASLKVNDNDFVNCSASTAGNDAYVNQGPTYTNLEIVGNAFHLATLERSEYVVSASCVSVVARDNRCFSGTSKNLQVFKNIPDGVDMSKAMTSLDESPFSSFDYANGVFVRAPFLDAVPGEYDVYLLIGQSNAAGRGALLAEDYLPLEGVMQWNPFTEQIQPAVQPLNLISTVRKKASMQGFNLAGPFAQKIYKETGRKVLLVVNARGETMMSAWMKEGNGGKVTTYTEAADDPEKVGQTVWLYDEAVRLTKQAMKYGTLKGILWHQGCGNSSEGNSASYLKSLKKMVDNLRADLNSPDVPFVAGQLLPEFKNAQYFNPMIITIGDAITNSYCATSEDCVSIGDGTHFDRSSHIKMGERYADIILKQVYGK